MLTKDELDEIKKVIEPINDDVESLKKAINPVKKDVAQTRKDVKVLISSFDREYVELRKRIEAIEKRLRISPKN